MPAPDTWVHELAKPWLDSEGYPLPESSGTVKWFYYDGRNMPIFHDTPNTAVEAARALDESIHPRSLSFVFAKTSDNLELMRKDPGYLARLGGLDATERHRLLHQCWEARPPTAGMFDRAWFEFVDGAPRPRDTSASARGWDLAATLPGPDNPDPDWTRGVRVDISGGAPYITDVVSRRDRPGPVNDLIVSTARADGPRVVQAFAIDPGAAGLRDEENIRQLLSGVPGIGPVRFEKAANKTAMAKAWSSHEFSGHEGRRPKWRIVRAGWTGQYLSEIERFPSRGVHDDQVDATSHAWRELESAAGATTRQVDRLLGTVR